ncbi:MAG TPA: cytochrome b/b6 domain-containing protein [Bacteroidia bacterium]|nr:cytochrome b/b6 domain-containing protein [Bacteroidia bacterium]
MKRIVQKHPLVVRWAHWVNFPVLGIMIWSGLMIYWANDIYRIGFGDKTLLKFFPDSFYSALNLDGRLADGMSLHFVFMWLFFANGLVYVLYTFFSGEWKYLWPNKRSFKQAWQVLLHDLRLSKNKPPQTKYNAAQRVAYSSIIVMGLGSLLTGIAIYKPTQFSWLCTILGGYTFARILHFALTIGYVLFFLIHIIQVIIAGWNNFRAMVTGFEVETIKPVPVEEPDTTEEKPPVA